MAKKTLSTPRFITEVPLTAEARELLIEQLFVDELTHKGEVFIPDDGFYKGHSHHKKAEHMVKVLCQWLGVKPGYIGLEFESSKNSNTDANRYTIYLEKSVLRDEFVLGAFLAYVLTCYLIEERKQIFLPETDQQATLLASASIVFGLGLVIANGISPEYSWNSQLQKSRPQMLKNFPVSNYSSMTVNFLRKYRITQTSYLHSLTPWATKRMNLPKSTHPSRAVLEARHRSRVKNAKLLGLVWVFMLVLGVGIFVVTQRAKPISKEILQSSQKITELQALNQTCKDGFLYEKQYADLSDIQTTRALNAHQSRCQSLQNQLDSAERTHNELLNK